jgi:DNA ligase-1
MPVKPMLAAKATDDQIRNLFKKFGHMIASPKLDGIRCLIQDGVAFSRSLKLIPNNYIRSVLNHAQFNGLDGELIIGSPTAHNVYNNTVSSVMRIDGSPKFTFYVFDHCLNANPYEYRYELLKPFAMANIEVLPMQIITNMGEMHAYEQSCLLQGYEGIILRDPGAEYKYGRSTAKQGGLIKVKRFEDSEALIIGIQEKMHNANEATTNELGRTQRSSHQENKIPMGVLGALLCRDIETGVEFNIGTGFTDELRVQYWNSKTIGKIAKYKSFKIGVKDAPRHPVFLGMRDPMDM